jgi:arylsulfatase A-like enzyme
LIRPLPRAAYARAVLLLGALASVPLACSHPSERELSGVVLVVIDTLRADRLGAYGNERRTSPVFDRLARRGVLFEQAISPSPWTLPSMIGLLTGSFPSEESFQNERLVGSVIEVLQRAGVRTAGFTEAGFASAHFGLSRGFETYHERPGKVALDRDSGVERDAAGSISLTFADAEQFLRELRDERFFLWIHTYEPHTPYLRGMYIRDLDPGAFEESFMATLRRAQRGEVELTDTERSYVAALYDGGVRVSDAHVGRLLRVLKETGRARSS